MWAENWVALFWDVHVLYANAMIISLSGQVSVFSRTYFVGQILICLFAFSAKPFVEGLYADVLILPTMEGVMHLFDHTTPIDVAPLVGEPLLYDTVLGYRRVPIYPNPVTRCGLGSL